MRAAGHRIFMFSGITFLTGAGLVAAACGTDNGTTATPGGGDSGRDGTGSSSGGSSGTSSSGSSGEDGGGAADCSAAPQLRNDPGPYCFSVLDAGDGGSTKNIDCASTNKEVCCSGQAISADGGFEPSTCEVAEAGAGGYTHTCSGYNWITPPQRWDCLQKSHCAAAGAGYCCAIGADAGVMLIPKSDTDFPGCNTYYQSAKYVGGTRCESECAAGEVYLCSTDNDCKTGKCVPIKIAGRVTGYCKL